MQGVNNYGSLLQAYSLKKIIEELGHQVEFIDIKKGEDELLNIQCNKLSSINENNNRNRLLYQVQRVKNKFSNKKAKKIFGEFRVNELGIIEKKDERNYDVCVIGSDEVFNCLQRSKWMFSSQLFGNVKNAKKVITYAACCGSTKEKALSEELKKAIVAAMTNLDSISVRDENTAKFVQALTGRECVYNLDPVAVEDFSTKIRNINLSGKLPKSYCIVYSYKDRIADEKTINAINNYCKNHGLVPIAPFGSQKWIKRKKTLTPFELLRAFENAECIITDTFHGTLFGAKFGKKMCVIIRDSNRNKLEDLTKRLGIEDHILTDISELETVLGIELERNAIDSVLNNARKDTFKYLENSLQ
ncbi:polysaccharide pyruvyl transferase family protein [Clostridium boliviensis]|nr:polysaccharide pyruvyl transferase family protein [Clostridium boliviensis]